MTYVNTNIDFVTTTAKENIISSSFSQILRFYIYLFKIKKFDFKFVYQHLIKKPYETR